LRKSEISARVPSVAGFGIDIRVSGEARVRHVFSFDTMLNGRAKAEGVPFSWIRDVSR